LLDAEFDLVFDVDHFVKRWLGYCVNDYISDRGLSGKIGALQKLVFEYTAMNVRSMRS
jgi:hypothetical protein